MREFRGVERGMRLLEEEIKRLNEHLPKSRVPLSEVLSRGECWVETVGGESILLLKEDAQVLASELPKEMRQKLKVPIVVFRDIDMGEGAFVVEGRFESYAVSRLLREFSGDFEEWKEEKLVIYKPQLHELVLKIGSLIVVGFRSTGLSRRLK